MQIANRSIRNKRRGFTLIELLVVIAIIGVLSSIVLASLQSARKKALDAKTVAEFHQIATSMELYASDHNGQYPYVDIHGSPTFNCIGGTDCMVVNLTPGVKLPGITLSDINTPLIAGSNNYNSRSFSYVPIADCNSSSNTCDKGQAVIMAPTYAGLMCQTVGVWETLHSCTTLPE